MKNTQSYISFLVGQITKQSKIKMFVCTTNFWYLQGKYTGYFYFLTRKKLAEETVLKIRLAVRLLVSTSSKLSLYFPSLLLMETVALLILMIQWFLFSCFRQDTAGERLGLLSWVSLSLFCVFIRFYVHLPTVHIQ